MLDEEFKYFRNNQKDIYSKFPDQYVVIKDFEVKSAANSFEEALSQATDKFEIGTFLIQLCTKDESGYTQRFYSRVVFA